MAAPPQAGAATAAGQAGAAPAGSSSKVGLVVAGVAVLVALGAAAAWQFAGKRDGAIGDGTANAASAVAPVVAAPRPAPPVPEPVTATTTPATNPISPPVLSVPVPAPTTATATPPDETRALPPPISRPLPTATRNDTPAIALPANPTAKPPVVAERNTVVTDRNASVDRPYAPTDAASSRARPPGRPVPRPGETESPTTTAGTGNAPNRTVESTSPGYPPPVAPVDRPRPLGSPALREPVPTVSRPVPPPTQAEAQPASAREACGKRVFIALALCMDEKCEEPRYRSTPECIAVLDRKRARETR